MLWPRFVFFLTFLFVREHLVRVATFVAPASLVLGAYALVTNRETRMLANETRSALQSEFSRLALQSAQNFDHVRTNFSEHLSNIALSVGQAEQTAVRALHGGMENIHDGAVNISETIVAAAARLSAFFADVPRTLRATGETMLSRLDAILPSPRTTLALGESASFSLPSFLSRFFPNFFSPPSPKPTTPIRSPSAPAPSEPSGLSPLAREPAPSSPGSSSTVRIIREQPIITNPIRERIIERTTQLYI